MLQCIVCQLSNDNNIYLQCGFELETKSIVINKVLLTKSRWIYGYRRKGKL